MLVSIMPNQKQLRELQQLCAETGKKLPQQIKRARREVARGLVTRMSRDVRSQINIKAADIKKHIDVQDSADSSKVTLSGDRIPLKHFGARQVSRGVSYRISKRGKSRSLVPGGFGPDIPRLGGHVFKRAGKSRFPIIKLLGPSPPAVAERAGLDLAWQFDTSQEFAKKLGQRIDYLLAVKRGEVK